MDLAKVIGTVVATRKDPSLEGTRSPRRPTVRRKTEPH